MSDEIKFGTDGWRDVIGDGFTFRNVRRVSQAACDVIRKTSKSRLVLIGYDRRFFSDKFAVTAAEVAAGNGLRVEISDRPISSPALSLLVHQKKAALGFMFTASHNPYYFNGFKLKGPHGGSVDETVTKQIEDRIDAGDVQSEAGTFKKINFLAPHISFIKKLVKIPNLGSFKGPVVFDVMHGAGADVCEGLFKGNKRAIIIREKVDPLFGGVNPEPIENNLAALTEAVLKNKASVGIAVDGDADRVGIVDEKGRYLPPHTVLPLILLHLIENRKLKGKVVQTVSMGYLTARIAKEFNLPFEEVSVGFKYIAKKMGEEKVLLGGEESGGYGIGLWSPERDGVLCGLLVLEYMAKKKKPLSVLVDEMQARFGASVFKRVDFPLKNRFDKAEWTTYWTANIGTTMAGKNIKSVNSSDGIKITTEDDAWVLMRPSGTEPLIRTYSEGPSAQVVQSLLSEAQRIVNTPLPSPKKSADEAKKARKKKAAAAAAAKNR